MTYQQESASNRRILDYRPLLVTTAEGVRARFKDWLAVDRLCCHAHGLVVSFRSERDVAPKEDHPRLGDDAVTLAARVNWTKRLTFSVAARHRTLLDERPLQRVPHRFALRGITAYTFATRGCENHDDC
jgi:hypothetical protein